MSLPLRITLRLIATVVLVWAMQEYLPQYIMITGGLMAWILIGLLLTAMNIIVRPILKILALPLHLFAAIVSLTIVNLAFTWLTLRLVNSLDPGLATMQIIGVAGWIVIAVVLGVSNALMKVVFPAKTDRGNDD